MCLCELGCVCTSMPVLDQYEVDAAAIKRMGTSYIFLLDSVSMYSSSIIRSNNVF